MHVPERARTAEARELQPRRRMALGDRTRLIDPHEEERDALGPRPLKRREPVTDLLDRGAEAQRKHLQIVAHLLRGGKERAIGHERRPGEVIGQPHLGDGARGLGLEAREIERRLQKLVLREQRQLQQKLKAPRLGGHAHREGERAGGAVELAQHGRVGLGHAHAHLRQASQRQPLHPAARRALGKAFGGVIDRVDIVVAVMEEVAHLVPGARLAARVLAPERLVETRQPLMGLAIGAVQLQKGARQRRCVRGGKPQIGQRWRLVAEDPICQRLAHVRHQPLGIAGAQFRHVKAEFLRQRQHHRRRERPVVVLHLVEIGQRHAQLGGEFLLRQPEPLARFAELGPGIELARGHGGRLPLHISDITG